MVTSTGRSSGQMSLTRFVRRLSDAHSPAPINERQEPIDLTLHEPLVYQKAVRNNGALELSTDVSPRPVKRPKMTEQEQQHDRLETSGMLVQCLSDISKDISHAMITDEVVAGIILDLQDKVSRIRSQFDEDDMNHLIEVYDKQRERESKERDNRDRAALQEYNREQAAVKSHNQLTAVGGYHDQSASTQLYDMSNYIYTRGVKATLSKPSLEVLGLCTIRLQRQLSPTDAEAFCQQLVDIVHKRVNYAQDNYPALLLDQIMSVQYVNYFRRHTAHEIAQKIIGSISIDVRSALGSKQVMPERILSIPPLPASKALLLSGGIYANVMQSQTTAGYSLYCGQTTHFGSRFDYYSRDQLKMDMCKHHQLIHDKDMMSTFRIVSCVGDVAKVDLMIVAISEAVIIDFIQSVNSDHRLESKAAREAYVGIRPPGVVPNWTGLNQESPWRRVQGMIVDGKQTTAAEVARTSQNDSCALCGGPTVDVWKVSLVDPDLLAGTHNNHPVDCVTCHDAYKRFLQTTPQLTARRTWIEDRAHYLPMTARWEIFVAWYRENGQKCPICRQPKGPIHDDDEAAARVWRGLPFLNVTGVPSGGLMKCLACKDAWGRRVNVNGVVPTKAAFTSWITHRRLTAK